MATISRPGRAALSRHFPGTQSVKLALTLAEEDADMKFAPFALAATLALASAGFAHGQQAMTLDDLDADRAGADQIKIEFEYGGSACETVGAAQIGENIDGVLAVTFPTTSTAEVCTQQIKEIEVEQLVAADASVTEVSVTLLAPDGSVLATGTDRVDED